MQCFQIANAIGDGAIANVERGKYFVDGDIYVSTKYNNKQFQKDILFMRQFIS